MELRREGKVERGWLELRRFDSASQHPVKECSQSVTLNTKYFLDSKQEEQEHNCRYYAVKSRTELMKGKLLLWKQLKTK